MKTIEKKCFSNKGAFVISSAFLLGIIMIGLGLGIALFSYFQIDVTLNTRYFIEAQIAAASGIHDGILRVIYNKNCPDAYCPSSYNLTIGNASVTVEICKDTCQGTGKTVITSRASALNRKSTMQLILDVNAITGKVQIISQIES